MFGRIRLIPGADVLMHRRRKARLRASVRQAVTCLVMVLTLVSGCTSMREYFHNGMKVGPNYNRPVAPVADQWIDSADHRIHQETVDLTAWWHSFNDPVLNDLVQTAYCQNLNVRETAFKVLQARADLGIARGYFFPQQQSVNGLFSQNMFSQQAANSPFVPFGSFPIWQLGFGLAWELDFWGKYRRLIQSADAHYQGSIEDYDAVLVTLVGDVAQAYVQLRIVEQQLEYVAENTKLQKMTLEIAKARFQGGQATDLDVEQAQSILAQTEAQSPQLQIQRRTLSNQLCVLMGMPAQELSQRLGRTPIPSVPPEVVIGIPANLLSRRPDVRREERRAKMLSELIGHAESDLYPMISINGTMNWTAEEFSQVFTTPAFGGSFGPAFQWNVLHYGRIVNNISRVESRFHAQVAKYQQTVLQAGQEAENAIVQFLRSQEQAQKLAVSVAAAEKAVAVATVQYKGGLVDFNRVSLIQQNLVQQQNLLAQARGNISIGMVQLFRALGGGWEIRLNDSGEHVVVTTGAAIPMENQGTEEVLPAPKATAE
jgi:NodT family efflux transporter outer membrane factor (OMF) lipoprotein